MKKKSIKEIEILLRTITTVEDPVFKALLDDGRKGIQLLIKQWTKKKDEKEKLLAQFQQMSAYELELYSAGYQFIAGIDEVGRGPLAGPVIAAAVVLPRDFYLPGLNDSKKLSEAKREAYYEVIVQNSLATGIGLVSPEVIDEVNIYQASKIAMQKAILQLSKKPDYLLIDAMKLPLEIPQKSIIKGDAKSISIAASSVFAKVTRDRMMKQFGEEFPQYGFEKHMGYGTKLHLEAIKTFGITTIHRRTFAPVKEALENR